jgi:branched-chain amino acid aminotransferase
MRTMVNVNGVITDDQKAAVSVFDHGFLYGEGIYETMRTYNRQPFLFDRHMRRLRTSAHMLELPVPFSNGDIAQRCTETMSAAGTGSDEAYIRILITRGVGDLSYDPAACPAPTIVVIVKHYASLPATVYDHGVNAVIAPIVRNHPGSVNPLIKSNNLLNNALAMQYAVKQGAFEAIMRNYRGELAECTTANLFIVKNGEALTPPLDAGLLAGITREFTLEIAAQAGVTAREQPLRDDDLFGADEAFLTGTTREIVPIVTVDNRAIGSGRPGPVSRALLQEFRKQTERLTGVPQDPVARA